MMNMLYARENLNCIHLLDNDIEEMYTHIDGKLVEDTGRVFEPDYILIMADSTGRAIIMDSIDSSDLPALPITWLDKSPLVTDFSRIINDFGAPSRFMDYLEKIAAHD
jgi:hypothetical protein